MNTKLPILLTVLFLIVIVPASAAQFDPTTGTITDARWKSGVPLGGIGDGKIELMTDGSFGKFTNQHNWDRPYEWAKGAFAAVRVQAAASAPVARMLRLAGPGEYDGVSNIQHTQMQGWFPRASIAYEDSALPIRVRLEAFSPLIPHDVKDSSLPVALLAYTVSNPSKMAVRASVLLAWPNLLGWGGRVNAGADNETWNDVSEDTQTPATAGALTGLRYATSQSYSGRQENVVGEDFVGVRQEPGLRVSTCPVWDTTAPTPAFWSGFVVSGHLAEAGGDPPAQSGGAVAAEVSLAPGETRTVHFTVAWAMPHMVTVQLRPVADPTQTASTDGVAALFYHDPSTRWSTNRPMLAGDMLVIDLGRTYTPSQLVLDSGPAGTDFPRGLRVSVSSNGQSWQTVADRSAGSLAGSSQTVALAPVRGRYLRLTNLGAERTEYWSIYGLTIHVRQQPDPLTLGAGAATAYLATIETRDVTEDVGHYWQNYWHTAPEIAAYADRNAERLLTGTRAWQDPVLRSSLPFWLKLKIINCAFPMFSNTVLTRDGRFTVLESPIDMSGATGTMDQRMAAHAFYTDFFPELDRAELEMYASCQQTDGRITHFDGNVHEVIGRPDVGYGITDWPDLSSAWVMQAVKLYRWTGDSAFLARMQPHLTRAMDWLDSDGRGDDHIPVGGSTYDYEHLPSGAFIYSASCYLGALRAARAVASPSGASVYDTRLAETQQAVMTNLWNGTYFRKWKQPITGQVVEDSFIANLAGDWLARLTGLPRTLPPDIIHRSIAQTIARHQKPFFPMPPMQVTPDGHSTTTSCYSLQHEPYLGDEAIYENYVDDGIETTRRIYLCAWELNHSPWDQSLVYDAPSGIQSGLGTYVTSPTTWFILNALGGTSIDLPHHRLYVSPRLATGQTELHIPVYFSRFWAWLDYIPAAHRLTLRVDQVFPSDPELQQTLYHTDGPAGNTAPATMTLTSVAADGDAVPQELPHPFVVAPGTTLDLSPFIHALGLPTKSETVDFEVKAASHRDGLPADHWALRDNLHDSPELAAAVGQAALDGDPATRWTTNRPMQPGDQLTLDMAAPQTVAKLVLDSTQSPADYPRGYVVEASLDGTTWVTVAHATADETTAAVQNGVLTITFPSTAARYLRITNEGFAPGLYWSVHERRVYGGGG